MYIIENRKSTPKFTAVDKLPYDEAFTLKDFPAYVYIRVKPMLNNYRVYIIRFDVNGNFVRMFDHPPDLTYSDVTCHNFTIKLLP
jgi:hypothetical protein